MKIKVKLAITGLAAGAVNGLFGGAGGMVLVPLLTGYCKLDDNKVFPASVVIIAPICVVSVVVSFSGANVSFLDLFPYLLGSALGGIVTCLWGKKISTLWLHRILGVLILWGGIRYLC